jgi:hypothetical protein
MILSWIYKRYNWLENYGLEKELFRFPFGFILDMGGEPLDRSGV